MDDIIRLGPLSFTIQGARDSDEAILGDARAHYWSSVARLKRRLEREISGSVTVAETEAKLRSLGIKAPPHQRTAGLPPASFAGERLSAEGREVLGYAAAIQAADPALAPTAIARKTTLLLLELAQPIGRPAVVEVVWRAARMPVSSTGAPFADPATGTITSRFPPAMLAACRQDIEARFGPILVWRETAIAAKPVTRRNDQPEHEPDGAVYKQVKRLLSEHSDFVSGTRR